MHTINGCQYDSLKAHIHKIFDSTGLLKLFMKQSASTYEIGKLRIIAAYRNKKLGTLLNEIIEGYVKENYKPNMKDVVSKRRGEI